MKLRRLLLLSAISVEALWFKRQEQVPLLAKDDTPEQTTATVALTRMLSALDTLQEQFFDLKSGIYHSGIDWTRSVIQTHVSATLQSVLQSSPSAIDRNAALDVFHRYFTHLTAFFYGQNWESLLLQAYDDMLWTSLGWISATQLLYIDQDLMQPDGRSPYISDWLKPFAERAKLFYDAAEVGWDDVLCGGGMNWSPWLEPYKNSITNELFISASIEMFLYYPPTLNANGERNATYLNNAIKAYNWFLKSNMFNDAGLVVDGYHLSNIRKPSKPQICDVRDEQTYTYNQGVLLSGLHGLYLATGDDGYLDDAHQLINNTLSSEGKTGGLMRGGIMEERCDSRAFCSQNGHTFKGIFFHHLTLFCDQNALLSPIDPAGKAPKHVSAKHYSRCAQYHSFILRNANAAWRTRNANGVVGTWWSAPDMACDTRPSRTFTESERREFEKQLANGDWDLPADKSAIDRYAVVGEPYVWSMHGGDLNDRGRGRTVESQTGGLGAFRAAWQVVWQNGY